MLEALKTLLTPIVHLINKKADAAELAEVATSGDIRTLKNVPNRVTIRRMGLVSGTVTKTISWDGNTTGLTEIEYNGLPQYLVSDLCPSFIDVQAVASVYGKADTPRELNTNLYIGTGCYAAGSAIVVTKAGTCSLAIDPGATVMSFNAPTTGIYFQKTTTGYYVQKLDLTYADTVPGYFVSERYTLTIDGMGTITATEITE